MKGLSAGESLGLPRIAGGQPPALKQPAAPSDSSTTDAGAASASRVSAAQAPGATAARSEEEDYSYTYLPPARHKYEFPADKSPQSEDWRYLLSLGLRVSAAMAVGYLIYHSEVGYLLGVTRRRRKGPGDGPTA